MPVSCWTLQCAIYKLMMSALTVTELPFLDLGDETVKTVMEKSLDLMMIQEC